MTVGSSRPMEDSWRIANAERVQWIGQLQGLQTMDAYQLCSQIAEVPVANIVDANYSVVVKAAKALLPAADAFGRDARRTPRESRLTRNDLRSPGDVATHTTLSSTPRKASAMDLQLTAKRVLVTGGARGIGRAIVGAFLDEGAVVGKEPPNWSKAICTYIPQHSS